MVGGGVKCWGANTYGQLGDGTTLDSATPVDVNGLTSGVSAIATGNGFTCALMTGGEMKCWGWNSIGQLGDGTTANKSTPRDVSGLISGVSTIAAGNAHACALMTGGGMKCWGTNYAGQLGDGTTTNKTTPVDVSGLTSGVSAIATTGGDHTCALTTGGGIKCWGFNSWGQLGDGTTADKTTPVDVSGLTSGVSAIASGGGHTCARMTSGGVKCWGNNLYGKLGDGTTANKSTPVDVTGFETELVAINYFAPTPINGPAQINVAAGYGKSVSVQSFTQGAHGTVACTNVGLCTYTPQADFAGPDSFQYTVNVSALSGLMSAIDGNSVESIESPTATLTGTIGIFVYRTRVSLPIVLR